MCKPALTEIHCEVRRKAVPVTGHGDPRVANTLKLSHFIENRLTGGFEITSLKRRPSFTPRKIPGTDLC
jgi:hypothetical protein